jgi:hypothetical protein
MEKTKYTNLGYKKISKDKIKDSLILSESGKPKIERKFAKIYITSKDGISLNQVHFLIASNLCLIKSLKKLSNRNYIAEVEFRDYANLLNLMQTKKSYYGQDISIRRIFKSMQLKKRWLNEPKQSFLIEVITGIEGLIKRPTKVKVVGDGTWVKAITKRWQEALDHPQKYQEMGILPMVDITKDGELRFHIVKSYNNIITFFEGNIDHLV